MSLSRFIFVCRKKLTQWLETFPATRNTKFKTETDLILSYNLQISGHCLRNIPITENSFRFHASFSHPDPKSYYLYAVINEVMSSCMSCMRILEWVEESEEERHFGYPKMEPGNETISGDRVIHLIEEGVIDELEVRFRKLQEYLCYLICFSETNTDKYFHLFLASEALADIEFANRDIKEFFGKPIENFSHQSKDLLAICKSLINEVQKNKCWFLQNSANFKSDQNPNKILTSYRHRYKKAIKISNDDEKVALGPTYKVGYGGSSKSAHALIKEDSRHFNIKDVKARITKIPFICLHILSRVVEIANIECLPDHQAILDNTKKADEAESGIFRVTKGGFEVGDLVTNDGSTVAEILELHQSSYGYFTYKVRYLINPNLEEIIEEWLPPRYVGVCLVKRRNIKNFYIETAASLIGEGDLKNIENANDETLYNYAKDIVLNLAKEGHLRKLFQPEQE